MRKPAAVFVPAHSGTFILFVLFVCDGCTVFENEVPIWNLGLRGQECPRHTVKSHTVRSRTINVRTIEHSGAFQDFMGGADSAGDGAVDSSGVAGGVRGFAGEE